MYKNSNFRAILIFEFKKKFNEEKIRWKFRALGIYIMFTSLANKMALH